MQKVNNIDLSIIILAYNSKSDLERLLPSISFTNGPSIEVIIVDNASGDGTGEWVVEYISKSVNQKISLIKNQNTGFAAGNNLGIKQAQGKYLLILNPDTRLEEDTLRIMLEFMEARLTVGISTCKVLLPNGKLDLACRRRFPNPWNGFKRLFMMQNRDYNFTNVDENQSLEIDACMGAFMLIRKSVLDTVGDFDEAFFMYGEDIDLCWRAKEKGFQVWYYPKTSITHFKGSASRKVSGKALRWFYEAMWIFYEKHYKENYPFFFNWLVWTGVRLRFLAAVSVNFLRKEKFVSKS